MKENNACRTVVSEVTEESSVNSIQELQCITKNKEENYDDRINNKNFTNESMQCDEIIDNTSNSNCNSCNPNDLNELEAITELKNFKFSDDNDDNNCENSVIQEIVSHHKKNKKIITLCLLIKTEEELISFTGVNYNIFNTLVELVKMSENSLYMKKFVNKIEDRVMLDR